MSLLKLKEVIEDIKNVDRHKGCPFCGKKVTMYNSNKIIFACGQEYVQHGGWLQPRFADSMCASIHEMLGEVAKHAKFEFTVG